MTAKVRMGMMGGGLRARRAGKPADPLALDFPGVADGVRSLAFAEAALASAASAQKWHAVPPRSA